MVRTLLLLLIFVINLMAENGNLEDSNSIKNTQSDTNEQDSKIQNPQLHTDNIIIQSTKELKTELEEAQVKRFVEEGILDKEALEIHKNENKDDDLDEYSDKPLLKVAKNFYQSDNSEDVSLLENIYGHIGFFGKTNALNKNVGGGYGVFSSSVGLNYDFKDMVFVDIGIYGLTPISSGINAFKSGKSIPYAHFIVHNAYVKYVAEGFFDITLGRFKENRDWIRNYAQGMQLNVNYKWLQVWLDWLDEQAYANREYLSNFDVFKKTYNNEWLVAGGIGVNFFGVDILPYSYYLNNYFWSVGGKLGAKIDINNKWRSRTIIHYVFLQNLKYIKQDNNKSQLFFIEQMARYRNENISVMFGLGLSKIWGTNFELANLGNFTRFETYNHQGYGIIAPGGVDNGGNSSNMFYADTLSVYGFIGFRINDFSMMFLGRNSKGKDCSDFRICTNRNIEQHQYSLGARYKIIDGLYIGGTGAFMLENRVNKSFAKGYLEFQI